MIKRLSPNLPHCVMQCEVQLGQKHLPETAKSRTRLTSKHRAANSWDCACTPTNSSPICRQEEEPAVCSWPHHPLQQQGQQHKGFLRQPHLLNLYLPWLLFCAYYLRAVSLLTFLALVMSLPRLLGIVCYSASVL